MATFQNEMPSTLWMRRNLEPSQNLHSGAVLTKEYLRDPARVAADVAGLLNGNVIVQGELQSLEDGHWVGIDSDGKAEDVFELGTVANNIGLVRDGTGLPIWPCFPVHGGGSRLDAQFGITVVEGSFRGYTTGFVADPATDMPGTIATRAAYAYGMPLTLVSTAGDAGAERTVLCPAESGEFVVAIAEGVAYEFGGETVLPITNLGAGYVLP